MASRQAEEVEACCEHAVRKFREVFGTAEPPSVAVFAPGRVNLIGEHTDYNAGCVLPMALHLVTVIVGRPLTSGPCRVTTCSSVQYQSQPENTIYDFPVPTCPQVSTTHVDRMEGEPHWVSYFKGVVALMNSSGDVPSFEAAIATSVPLGGGLSSSAALEVATSLFVQELSPSPPELSARDRALLCQKAEHVYAGMPCGIMDQFVSVMAREGHALFIDCRNQETRDVPLSDPDIVVMVTDSGYKHELVEGEYRKRRETCESAARKLGKPSLREVSLEELEEGRGNLDDDEYCCASHVITEIQRTLDAEVALNEGKYETFGQLMNESHASLRDDYNVSCNELNRLVNLTQGKRGVYGSRMTGGGFGGCTVTLLDRSAVEEVQQVIQDNYRSREGKEATFYVATASSGAGVIPVAQLASVLHGLEQSQRQEEEGAGFSLRRNLGGLLVPVGVALAAGLLVYLIGLKQ